jgi:hypothetical protein
MAVLIRSQRPKTTSDRPSSFFQPRSQSEAEAPDRGNHAVEAPESRLDRRAEAPDAGEGRAHAIEHEFTHGRSQS